MAQPTPPVALPAALSGDRFEFASRAGRLSAYVAGVGPPLLLLHSVNTAASAAEVRPLHEHFAASRTVFALDLPGFGFSERSDRPYTPRLMTNAVEDMVERIRQLCGPLPLDALALTSACEFLARAAAESLGLFRSLALVSPAGFSNKRDWRRSADSAQAPQPLYRALRGPGLAWGSPLFRGLTCPRVLRHVLQRSWGVKAIDDTLWQHALATTRQPGAEFAPLCFLGGALFSSDVHEVYKRLKVPVWMSHGVRGDFTGERGQALMQSRANWRSSTFDSGALPHFELPDAFMPAYSAFLADPKAELPP